MDKSTLIDLNSTDPNQEDCFKLPSPLIPPPNIEHAKCLPRLSDGCCDPFEKVLINITNNDDPFEIVSETAFCTQQKFNREDKENIGYLISPFQTPSKANGKNMETFLCEDLDNESERNETKLLILELCRSSQNENQALNSANNSSLQCLSDSILNASMLKTDIYEQDVKKILPDSVMSSKDEYSSNNENVTANLIERLNKSCNVTAENDKISEHESCILNNAFINSTADSLKHPKLSTNSSINPVTDSSRHSLHFESLGTSEISSVSSANSNKDRTSFVLNKEFFKERTNLLIETPFQIERKCMSTQKLAKDELNLRYLASSVDIPQRKNFNNSFGGFSSIHFMYNLNKKEKYTNDDPVFLEASYLGNMFSKFARGRAHNPEDEELSECSPPWLEDDINFKFDENDDEEKNEDNNVQLVNNKQSKEMQEQIPEILQQGTGKEETETGNYSCVVKNEKGSESINEPQENANIRDLLHNLSEILKCDGQIVDKKKLGENLLKSLTLALNVENSNILKSNAEDASSQVTIEKSESKSKVRAANVKEKFSKKVQPLIKTNTMNLNAPLTKNDKDLKPKLDKEKATVKRGPLKAIIPVKNMAKTKNDTASKLSTFVTPPKSLHAPSSYFQKRTCTPNDLKITSPMAQSTPDNCKTSTKEAKKGSSVGNRKFSYFSPLSRPVSTEDIRSYDSSENKSLRKNYSGSAPNINDISQNKSMPKQYLNTSASMSRRKSATDLKSNINNNGKPSIQKKRSTSVENRRSTTSVNASYNKENKERTNVNKTLSSKTRNSLISRPRSYQSKELIK